MTDLITFINTILWGSVLIYLLLGAGIYFTLSTRVIQIRHFTHMFSVLKNSTKSDSAGISPFQALCTSLAARVGTGHLTGVAIALSVGGPGAIFWMWVVAFIGMATSFIESTLAQLYKTKDDKGHYRGGPAYYMEKGLGMRWMGIMFAIFLLISYGMLFNAVQANSIAQASFVAFNFDPFYVGIALVIMSGIVIVGGMRFIAQVAEKIVPLMAATYLLMALWVIGLNIERIPAILVLIFKSAFGLQEAAAGVVGYGFTQAMTQGVQRGLFSNEAGMGSAPNVAASATPYPLHPASQGYMQMLAVFIDTIVICTASAAIILASGALDQSPTNISGIELIQRALANAIGAGGPPFVAIAIFFFSFTSIIANYAYAESNLIFLQRNHPAGLLLFRCVALTMVMLGTLADMPTLWKMADTAMALMAITNLTAILLLSGVAFKLAEDYNHQRWLGRIPSFDVSRYPELEAQLEPGIWKKAKLS